MAHTGIFATSDEILVKAGENVDAQVSTEARINAICLQAESYINVRTRKQWTTAVFAAANATVKHLLGEAESNLVAIYMINFNMAGFTSRVEAELMMNVLKVRFNECINLLKNQNNIKWMDTTT